MKLRQKLAMVLAAAMVVTAVPVTTMAASTNTFNKTLSIVADKPITTGQELFLTVEYDEKATTTITADKGTTDTFFINATEFKFDEDAYKDAWFVAKLTQAGVTITAKEEQLKVVVDKTVAVSNGKASVNVPIIGTPKKGNPALTVDAQDSLATSGKYALAGAEIVTDKVLVATAGDVKNISVEGFGTLADITIEETVADSLDEKKVTITLPNSSDLIFNSTYATGLKVGEKVGTLKTMTAKGKRGLNNTPVEISYSYELDKDNKIKSIDNKKLVVDFTNVTKTGTRGSLVLEGLEVQAEDKKDDVSLGEVKVTVASKDNMDDTKLVVANVADYGVAYTVKEVKELTAGQGTTKVKVKLKENAVDTLNKNRPVYFTLEEGYFVNKDITSDQKVNFSFNEDGDELALTLNTQDGKFEEGKINEFEFEVEIAAKATHKDAVVMVATSRNFEKDLKLEVAKITPAIEIKAEPITVKAGLKDQVGGKIVIKETKEEKLAKNKKIIIAADDAYGFKIEDAKIEVTDGDVKIDSEVNKNGEVVIKITRSSDEASEITISDIKVTTSRTVPEGSFDFLVGGTAISQDKNLDENTDKSKDDERFDDALTIENFIVVGTKNTEDITNAATAKEIVLTVGSPAYTVNGEAKTADAAAYIDESNRTMVPVKFVAEEFGKIDFNSLNGVGTVTVFKDGSVLQFQNGSNIMNKNGINIPMDTKVVIKDGRTYVPFKYVADGLGIGYSYDAATKSITFSNQAK